MGFIRWRKLIYDQCSYNTGTSQLICNKNQMIGFYTVGVLTTTTLQNIISLFGNGKRTCDEGLTICRLFVIDWKHVWNLRELWLTVLGISRLHKFRYLHYYKFNGMFQWRSEYIFLKTALHLFWGNLAFSFNKTSFKILKLATWLHLWNDTFPICVLHYSTAYLLFILQITKKTIKQKIVQALWGTFCLVVFIIRFVW